MERIPSCIEQIDRLVAEHPQRSFVRLRTEKLMIWHANLQPSVVNENYLVEIRYESACSPEIRVLAPKLVRYEGSPLPHVYPCDRLCTYYPKAEPPEWTPAMWLSDTILPWTARWLVFYEIWAVTGAWHGGGIHETK